MVGGARKINTSKFKSRLITCRNYKNYNPRKMIGELGGLDWSNVTNNLNVNDVWDYMKAMLLQISNRHALKITKKVKGKPAPWLTSKVKDLMNERDKLLRKSQRSKNELDISKYKQ